MDATVSSMTDQQRAAIAAALSGDWNPADKLELQFLNSNTDIKRRIAGQIDNPLEATEATLKAVGLEHDRGPASITAVLWRGNPCIDCDGTGMAIAELTSGKEIEVDCPSCDDEVDGDIRTDLDGNLLGDQVAT